MAVKTVTHEDLQKLTAAIKDPSFSSLSLQDQYDLFMQAAVSAAEAESTDSSRFATFVSVLRNWLSESGAGWGGTSFGFIYWSSHYWVDKGDTSSIYFGAVDGGGGRLYLAVTDPPR